MRLHQPIRRAESSHVKLRSYLTRLIALCIAPLLVLAIVFAALRIDDMLERRDREAERLVSSTATSIDRMVEARIGALQMLATSPLLDSPERWRDLYRLGQGFREQLDRKSTRLNSSH